MSSYHHDVRQASKAKGKVVKPILRKFTQSEKNSLDLDRSLAEQQNGLGIYDAGSRSAHDVSFIHTSRRGYHNRSTSGTSQFSTATSTSGHRAGSFVHPFQQTPRPYTPPLGATHSYQNSLRESENSTHSPVVIEDDESSRLQFRNNSNLATATNRAPSLTRASTSLNNINNPKPLRIQTKQQPSSSRLARESHTSLSSTLMLSPEFASPTDTTSPVSALRSSMDLGFRLRSRSDVHHTNAETIQEARRRWDEEQKLKDEKIARREVKALEKKNKTEAKNQIQSAHRRSSASERARAKRSKSDLTIHQEKGVFGHEYTSTPVDSLPYTDENMEEPKRSQTTSSAHNAKKRANSTFHAVLMWLRTRILRMKKKTSS